MKNQLRFALPMLALLVANPAIAQDAASDDVDGNDAIVEEVVVTGSRIARNPADVAAPLVSVGSDDVLYSNTPDLGQFLQELPQLSSFGGRQSISADERNGSTSSTGLSRANLRGLGTSRTLVLVNGKRHVSGAAGTQAIDLSTIPPILIRSVEVITGGASAVYGSDAVTGVVNIILDDELEGIVFDTNYNRRFENSAGENYRFAIAGGSELADGRGHITASVQYDRQSLMLAPDQPFSNNYQRVNVTDANNVRGDGNPDHVILPNVAEDIIGPFSVFNVFGEYAAALGDTGRWSFTEDGRDIFRLPEPIVAGRYPRPQNLILGDFAEITPALGPRDPYLTIIPSAERFVSTASVKFDVGASFEAYADTKYSKTSGRDVDFPRQIIFARINVADNPYLPESVRARFLAGGVGEVRILDNVLELETSGEWYDRQSSTIVAGLRGDFDAGFSALTLDAYAQYGSTRNEIRRAPQRITPNLGAAIDAVIDPATGRPACRSHVPSAQPAGYRSPASVDAGNCAPLNPFGIGLVSQEALDFVFKPATNLQEVDQAVLGLTFTGDTNRFANLPGGPVYFAGGVEYRDESAAFDWDTLEELGAFGGPASDSSASFDVSEVFAEVSVPVLDTLTLDGAVRYADYSHAGGATAWKVSGNFAPVERFGIRGTYSEAVRAPNLTEAFSPASQMNFLPDDLCDFEFLANETQTVANNCAALGLGPDFDAFDGLTIFGSVSGNENLTPEESESYTFGVVFRPFEGWEFSIDYYSIEITDAIASIGGQDIVNLCLRDETGINNQFCDRIARNPGPGDTPRGVPVGGIIDIASGFVNVAALETSGFDVAGSFFGDASDLTFGMLKTGTMSFNIVYTNVDELSEFPFQNDPSREDVKASEIGRPKHQFKAALAYSGGLFDVRWELLYIGNQVARNISFDEPDIVSPDDTGTTLYNDVFVSKTLDWFGSETMVYAGINNLFDEEPPIAALELTARNEAANFDQYGRNYVLGARVQF